MSEPVTAPTGGPPHDRPDLAPRESDSSSTTLRRETCVYVHHVLPLECDIYSAASFPPDKPVFLYFHPGGLVAGNRRQVPPWLIQVCYKRQWPLICPTYRFVPQASGTDLLADAKAAFDFAGTWKAPPEKIRKIIAGGGSAGFFLAAVLGHSNTHRPIALFSRTGIPSFQHPFFSSSTMLTPEPIPEEDVAHYLGGELPGWLVDDGDPGMFEMECLTADGSKNADYSPGDAKKMTEESLEPSNQEEPELRRGMLYDYFLFNNSFPELVTPVDLGFPPPNKDNLETRLQWPPTVVIHGDNDYDFPLEGNVWMRDSIGENRVALFIAKGQEHLFEMNSYIEDDGEEMEVVRQAVLALDKVIEKSA